MLHPVVEALIKATLTWPHQLGMTVLSEVQPGEIAQLEIAQLQHRDGAVYPLPAEFPEVMVNTIWALDEWRSDKGATLVVPGFAPRPCVAYGGNGRKRRHALGFNQTNEYFGFIAGRPPLAWLSRVAATS